MVRSGFEARASWGGVEEWRSTAGKADGLCHMPTSNQSERHVWVREEVCWAEAQAE